MPPGLRAPSGNSESHRSQTVVAPMVTAYSHDGLSVCNSTRYAASVWPFALRASVSTGVPRKPVAIRKPLPFTMVASRSAACCRCSGPSSRSNCSAIAYAVAESDRIRPDPATYSVWKADRTSAASLA